MASVECGLRDKVVQFRYDQAKGKFIETDENSADAQELSNGLALGPPGNHTSATGIADGAIQLAKECWCTQLYNRPVEYCPANFNSCVVRGSDGLVSCYELSRSENLLRGVWPIGLFWYGLLILAWFCSHRGLAARNYVRRKVRYCCCRRRPEEASLRRDIDVLIEDRAWFALSRLRRAALLRTELIRRLNDYPGLAWLVRCIDVHHDDPNIHETLRRNVLPGTSQKQRLWLKVKPFKEDSEAPAEASKLDAPFDESKLAVPFDEANDEVCVRTDTLPESDDDDDDENGNACAICLKVLEEGERIGDLACGHLFHTECLKDWLRRKNSCPLCQQKDIAEQTQSRPKRSKSSARAAATNV